MTRSRRRIRAQRVCAASGFVAGPVALLALFGSGVMPPQAAHDTARQIARFDAHHRDLKMAGLLLGFTAIGLVGPLVTVISLQLRRAERGGPAVGSTLQLVAGTVTWVFLGVPLLIMFTAAYRAGHVPASTTQTLHDLGWILFLIPLAPFIVQNVAIAYVVFTDDHPQPLFPRWLGYANLFIAASFLPDLLLGFFKTGPFAYQGLFSFWLPTVTYGVWLNLVGFTTWRAIGQAEPDPTIATGEKVAHA